MSEETQQAESDPAVIAVRAWQAAREATIVAIDEEGRMAKRYGYGSPEHQAAAAKALGPAGDAEDDAMHAVAVAPATTLAGFVAKLTVAVAANDAEDEARDVGTLGARTLMTMLDAAERQAGVSFRA